MLTQYFVSCVHVRFYFSLPLIFTLLAASISLYFLPQLWISMFFFLQNSPPLFSITRSSSFSAIHVSVNIKNNAKKRHDFVVVFSFQKSGWPCVFLPNKTLSCIWVAIPADWVILHWYACGADGRSLAWRMVMWLPNFLGCVDYHISLAMGLRPRAVRSATRGAPLK